VIGCGFTICVKPGESSASCTKTVPRTQAEN
jgi:hypothetical protein